ncbi:phosphatidate cytidylyltransferase [Porcipelethomonas sp.]|uniref:phosphatidate cytidylyltransferase n=1 Tax=Porcipelethomonas sp. TaxID=2981675 RepID=UPI003EF1E7DB
MGTRLISAAVGIVIAVIILILHDTIVLNIAVGLISAIMVYEVLRAGRCIKLRLTCIPAVIYAAVNPFLVTGSSAKYRFSVTFLIMLCIFATYIIQHKTLKYYRLMFIIASTLLISNAMCTLIIMHDMDKVNGFMYLIMGLCGAWLADSGAYFAGTFFGKRKLCPEVSPKKTVEGFIGGIFVTGLLFMLINFGYSKILPNISDYTVHVNYLEVCLLGMLLAVVGTVGDLSASVLKRQCGIKDYGNIMPGHGGLMDRFDSVVFVAPCLYAFITVFNIYK